MLLLTDSVEIADAKSALTVSTFSPQRAALSTLPLHVNIRVIPRRELASVVRERTAFHGRVVDIRTTFSGVRTDFKIPRPDDDVIVPLSPSGAGSTRALELFWHARRSSDPSHYPHARDGPVPNAEVSLAGTLHRRALPRFVVNSYRRAGVDVVHDYFVLEPELSNFDRTSRRVIVFVVGWGIAVLLVAWAFLSNPKRRRKNDGPAPK